MPRLYRLCYTKDPLFQMVAPATSSDYAEGGTSEHQNGTSLSSERAKERLVGNAHPLPPLDSYMEERTSATET